MYEYQSTNGPSLSEFFRRWAFSISNSRPYDLFAVIFKVSFYKTIWSIRCAISQIKLIRCAHINLRYQLFAWWMQIKLCFHFGSFESGVLEDPAQEAPKDMYEMTCDPEQAPDKSETLRIEFKKGKTRLRVPHPHKTYILIYAAICRNKYSCRLPYACV